MNKPPDQPHKSNSIPNLKWDKSIQLNLTSKESVYMMMSRTNGNGSLSHVSPFLIKKAIDGTCGSEVLECKKTRNGQWIIKTKDHIQANKLATLIGLTNEISIEVKPHKYLNTSKGVIYCPDLIGIDEEEILEELKAQKVCEVKKILKNNNGELKETGLNILTFATPTMPTKIKIGYLTVETRPYTQQPLRCKNCFRYYHSAKYCNVPKICYNCSEPAHLEENTKEACSKQACCINCKKSGNCDFQHPTTDKKCPIFVKEFEIQSIKATHNVDNKTARAMYNEKHIHQSASYASIVSKRLIPNSNIIIAQSTASINNNQKERVKCKTQTITNELDNAQPPTTTSTRKIINYSDKLTESDSEILTLPATKSLKKQTVKILPKNTSLRTKKALKRNIRSPQKIKSKESKLNPLNKDTTGLMDEELII